VIITDHNVDETLAITDRAYLLYEGKVLMTGTPEDLAADPEVRKRYLGQYFELRRSPKIDQLRREAEERRLKAQQNG
jgi:lipopolysaccharide export system ATP-binding protein